MLITGIGVDIKGNLKITQDLDNEKDSSISTITKVMSTLQTTSNITTHTVTTFCRNSKSGTIISLSKESLRTCLLVNKLSTII